LRERAISGMISGNLEEAMGSAKKGALESHRARRKRAGFVRVELRARKEDAALLKGVASALADPARQAQTRALLLNRVVAPKPSGLKALLEEAPLEGVDIERSRDSGRAVEL
jgi:hypothetical protein